MGAVLSRYSKFMRKTKRQIQAEVIQVGKLLASGFVDREIMDSLGLKSTAFYIYKRKLYQQTADIFQKERIQDLYYHKHLLHDRLTKLYRRAESRLLETRIDPVTKEVRYTIDGHDLAPNLLAAQNLAVNIFKLEMEGLRVLQGNNKYGRIDVLPESLTSETDGYLGSTGRGGSNGESNILQPGIKDAAAGGGPEAGATGGDRTTSLETPFADTEKEQDESEIY